MACSSCGKPRTTVMKSKGSSMPGTRVVESQSLKTTSARTQTAVASNPNSSAKRTTV